MSISFVTVGSFENSLLAWIFCNRLREAGIDAFVVDEHFVNVHWIYSNAVGGVKVQIPSDRMTDYDALMAERDEQPEAPRRIRMDDDNAGMLCPKCGSDEIFIQRWSKQFFAFVWLLTGIYFPVFCRQMYCFDCGHDDSAKFNIDPKFRIVPALFLIVIISIFFRFCLGFEVTWVAMNAIPIPR